MKGKTLVRIGAAFTALSMLGTMSAFAANEVVINSVEVNGENFTIDYATDTTGDSTFLVFDATNGAEVLAGTATEWEGMDIYDIQQQKDKLTTLRLKAGAAQKSVLFIGVGGAGVTADFQAVNMTAAVKSVTQHNDDAAKWENNTALINAKSLKNALPSRVSVTRSAAGYNKDGVDDTTADANIVSWSDGVNTFVKDTTSGEFDFSSMTAATGEKTLTPVVEGVSGVENLPTVTVNVTDTITISDWTLPTGNPSISVLSEDANDVPAFLKANKQASTTLQQADFAEGGSRRYAFEWSLVDDSKADALAAKTAGEYEFAATGDPIPQLKTDEEEGALDNYNFAYPTSRPQNITVTLNEKPDARVTGLVFLDKDGNEMTADNENILDIGEVDKADATIDRLKALDKLPTQVKITEAKVEGESVTLPTGDDAAALIFDIETWTGLNPVEGVTSTLVANLVKYTSSGPTNNFTIVKEGDNASPIPKVKVKVKDKPVIDDVTYSATLNAGTIGEKVLTEAEVKAEIKSGIAVKVDGQPVEDAVIDIVWEAITYDPNTAGTYTFAGTVTAEGYTVAEAERSISVAVTVNEEETPVPSGVLGDANNDGYANAADATLVFQYAAGILQSYAEVQAEQRKYNGELSESEYEFRADVDKDGYANAADSTYIFQVAAGILEEYPDNSSKK